MKTENLYEGQEISNYKELCEILEMPVKTGNAKEIQIKDVERYCKIGRNGHKMNILEVYSIPIKRIETKKDMGTRSIYVDDISIQLMGYLSRNKKNEEGVFLTANQIFLETGMMNSKYLPTKNTIKEFIEHAPVNITKDDVSSFYHRTEKKMREIMKVTLENLRRRFIIIYRIRHMIKEKRGSWHFASEAQEENILDTRNDVLKIMGLTVFDQAIYYGRVMEFFQRVQDLLKENFDWEGCYSGYYISSGERLEDNIARYKQEIEEKRKYQLSLNSNIIKYISGKIGNLYNKTKLEYDNEINRIYDEIEEQFGENVDRPQFKSFDEFEKGQFFMVDELIKLK
jgi:hypothetical protein